MIKHNYIKLALAFWSFIFVAEVVYFIPNVLTANWGSAFSNIVFIIISLENIYWAWSK